MATATTVIRDLGVARSVLQQIISDYATTPFNSLERQRVHDDIVGLRIVLNSLANISSGGR
jgi:hypothetical protein